MYELAIEHEGRISIPVIQDGIVWQQERQGSPGKLTFSVLQDAALKMREGDRVALKSDGTGLFFGFIFERKRGKDQLVSVTAYDQLRYLKYKDSYSYENKTAAEVIRMVADDHNLTVGELADTGFRIPHRMEENKTLFDVIYNAMTLTTLETGAMYILYDDFGKLTLKTLASMLCHTGICDRTAENFDYSSSIDGETYNRVKLDMEGAENGGIHSYVTEDPEHIRQWGILQYYQKIKEGGNLQSIANQNLLKYNKETQKLSVKNALGCTDIRAGSLMPVTLLLGDMNVNKLMLVEKASHRFDMGGHLMDLTLRGDGFSV